MYISLFVLTSLGTLTLFLSGYLWGIRRGRETRELLQQHLQETQTQLSHTQELFPKVQTFQEQFATQLEQLQKREQEQQSYLAQAIQQVHHMVSQQQTEDLHKQQHTEDFKKELFAVLQPLVSQVEHSSHWQHDLKELTQRSEKQNDLLKETIQQALAPILEQGYVSEAILQLGRGRSIGREALPQLLDNIAQTAGFSTVLLSDEFGLPVANNQLAKQVEMHAGISSLLFTLIDRAKAYHQSAPRVIVLHHEDGQIILHRIFQIHEERYILTAISTGRSLPVDVLDPTLRVIEQALQRTPLFSAPTV